MRLTNFSRLFLEQKKVSKVINKSRTTLGCGQLLTLKRERIPEFSTKSIIILDGDAKIEKK